MKKTSIFFTAALVFAATLAGAAEMFVTQRGADTLSVANLDGSEVQSLIPSAGSNIRGVAIDIGSNDLFYADNGADVIYRSRLDGSGRTTIVSGLGFPADVALDLVEEKVYWCDRNNNRIERADYDGSNRETVLTSTQPYYLDLDLTNGKIYWGDFNAGNVFRANLADGTGLETFVGSNIQTRGVKVDPFGGFVYWCDRESHKVQRRTIDGGPIEDLYTGLDTPHGMTLDIAAGKVYWVDTGTNAVAGSRGAYAVNRGDMDGSGPHEVLVAMSGPWDITLDTRVANYEEWIERVFPITAAPGQMLPGADLDHDGITNIVEYFSGLDPFKPQTALVVELFDHAAPGNFLVNYRQTFEPITDVAATVEFSTDAVNWQSGQGVSIEEAIGFYLDPVTIRVVERPLAPLADSDTLFARLRVEFTE